MANDPKEDHLLMIHSLPEKEANKEVSLGSEETDFPSPLTVTSRVLYMLGDITSGSAYRLTQWLESVRKRSGRYPSSGFPRRPSRVDTMLFSAGESAFDLKTPLPSDERTQISLWERLGKASRLDINSSCFSWDQLSSLHHTEHASSAEHSEDDMNKALEITVNSGGVVFFALFNQPNTDDSFPKEAAAVIKISSSRMTTQSERLGYEFAKWLGVQTPQGRVIHNSSVEWRQIKEAATKARDIAISEGDEVGEVTCSELLEALDMSRCLFLMNYIHGAPLLESLNGFDTRKAAGNTAAALGRILMLDLVIRNEDRLPCPQLGWRGNHANLLLADKMSLKISDALEDAYNSAIKRYRPKVIRTLQKERRAASIDNTRLIPHNSEPLSQSSSNSFDAKFDDLNDDFQIVAIDSVVPRRPPAGKRETDRVNYPKLVELLINRSGYSSSLLHEITGGKLGSLSEDSDAMSTTNMRSVIHEFRSGFRAALRDLQGFHIFLLTLHRKLDSLLRAFLDIIDRATSGESEKDDVVVPESLPQAAVHCPSPLSRERILTDQSADLSDTELHNSGPRSSGSFSSGFKESSESSSPISREGWHGKFYRGSGEPLHSLRLTAKLRDFHKYAKVDAELNKELEQWNEMLKNDVINLCQENNFNTGFFECSDNNIVVDAYELKVRLEHILERISMISDAANTEKPSSIMDSLFIGGALAARSVYTLQNLGITHILCLCANEIGISDSQYPDMFEYQNFSICDSEDTNVSSIFDEASNFIDYVECKGGKVLVHCFEGRSRSVTVVIAYLMLRKNLTLLGAWNVLKQVHRRAQPNDGFARTLQELDQKLHGKVSMEWQQRKPVIKVCPICGKRIGLSSSSLKLHLQEKHKKLSSGSVDSAMTMEIQKALTALKISRGGSASPPQRQSHSKIMDD